METWPTEGDLRAYRSVPPDPRAAVLLLHGFGEHAGRHAATAAAFARLGIAVYSYDQRGHGASPGARALVSDFDAWVDEARGMRDRVAAEQPGRPLFLMGASMGGLMAVRSAQRDPAGLAGVVLISPALDLGASAPPVVRALSAVISRVAPSAPVATLELAALSRDPAVAAAYVADPLTHHGAVPARTGAELLAAGAAAMAAAPRWRLPAYIIAGDADRIVPAAGTQRFVAAAQSVGADVTLQLVAGGYHEPLTEAGGDRFIGAAAEWILDRANGPPAVVGPESADIAGQRRVYTWREGLAFGAAVNIAARLAGTNTGRYQEIARPWFAPPGWVFPLAWSINSTLAIWGNLRVLNGPPSADRTAYLRLWAGTWVLYTLFGYAFFRRRSPLLGLLVTVNFLVLSVLSASRAVRIERDLWKTYATLLPWLVLATAVAGSVALDNPDPLLDPPDTPGL